MLWRRRNLLLGTVVLCCLFGATLAMLRHNLFEATAYFRPEGNFEKFYADFASIPRDEAMARLYKKPNLLGHDFAALPMRSFKTVVIHFKSIDAESAESAANVVQDNYMNALKGRYEFTSEAQHRGEAGCSALLAESSDEEKFDACVKESLVSGNSASKRVVFQRAELPDAPIYGFFNEIILASLIAGLMIGLVVAKVADIVQKPRRHIA